MRQTAEEQANMVDPVIVEEGIVAGNYYPKYSTQNPISRFLVDRFLRQMDGLVAEINPAMIHEVGCGEGDLIARYVESDRVLLASDFSKQIIAKARENAKRNKHRIKFMVKSVYTLQEEDSAPLVLCSEVLEHLESPVRAMEALSRIAKPYLIASVPREPLWRLLNMARGKYTRHLGNTPGHLQHFSKSAFVKLLNEHFEVMRVLEPLPWTLVLARVKEG